mmetsp:Transcript_15008/g.28441  ORF Transcript_15008/g.28441 Transcript_15008/m.28441 type:complete len:255 (-) Transcript_15008:199-963(-)
MAELIFSCPSLTDSRHLMGSFNSSCISSLSNISFINGFVLKSPRRICNRASSIFSSSWNSPLVNILVISSKISSPESIISFRPERAFKTSGFWKASFIWSKDSRILSSKKSGSVFMRAISSAGMAPMASNCAIICSRCSTNPVSISPDCMTSKAWDIWAWISSGVSLAISSMAFANCPPICSKYFCVSGSAMASWIRFCKSSMPAPPAPPIMLFINSFKSGAPPPAACSCCFLAISCRFSKLLPCLRRPPATPN